MKKVLKWRYYCEFCKKSGMSAYHIARHEQGCTANPQRICGLCQHAKVEQKPIEVIIKSFISGGLENLRGATEGCPACMLAAIRQSGLNKMTESDKDGDRSPVSSFDPYSFNFRQELKDFWNELSWDRYE